MISRRQAATDDPPVSLDRFVHDDAVGPDTYFQTPGYQDRRTAERAWRRVRREVWAITDRGYVPKAAEVYDDVTFNAWRAANSAVQHGAVPFNRTPVDEAIAEDRASIQAFRDNEPAAADSIAHFLDQLLADLRIVEEAMAMKENNGPDYGGEAYRLLHSFTGSTYGQTREEANHG
jgi:hypothetical protein